jgi:hypothetical protein
MIAFALIWRDYIRSQNSEARIIYVEVMVVNHPSYLKLQTSGFSEFAVS